MNSKQKVQKVNDIDMDMDTFVPYLLSKLHSYFQKVLAGALDSYDLIVPEWRVLLSLSKAESCTINDLVRLTVLPQSTVSRTVTNLHKKALVSRGWNSKDNRIAEIRLSPKGKKYLAKVVVAVKASVQKEVDRLAPEETDHLVDIMRVALRRLGRGALHEI